MKRPTSKRDSRRAAARRPGDRHRLDRRTRSRSTRSRSRTRRRSATTWRRRSTWRTPAGRARSGSTSRSTSRRPRSIRPRLAGFTPASRRGRRTSLDAQVEQLARPSLLQSSRASRDGGRQRHPRWPGQRRVPSRRSSTAGPRPDDLAGHGPAAEAHPLFPDVPGRSRRAAPTSPSRTADLLLVDRRAARHGPDRLRPRQACAGGEQGDGRHRRGRDPEDEDDQVAPARSLPTPARSCASSIGSSVRSTSPREHDDWVRRCQDWNGATRSSSPSTGEQDEGVSTYCPLGGALRRARAMATSSPRAAPAPASSSFSGVPGQAGPAGAPLTWPRRDGLRPAGQHRRLPGGRSAADVCVDGDGGFQMNIQELETVRRLRAADQDLRDQQQRLRVDPRLPGELLPGNLVAADATSGLTLPDVMRGRRGLRLARLRDRRPADLRAQVRAVLETPGPVVCEVVVARRGERSPAALVGAATRRQHGLQAARGPVAVPRPRGVPRQHDRPAAGRLMHIADRCRGVCVPPSDGRIQCFPRERWREEFALAAAAGLDAIEWIYDRPRGGRQSDRHATTACADQRAVGADVMSWFVRCAPTTSWTGHSFEPTSGRSRSGPRTLVWLARALRDAGCASRGHPALRRCLADRLRQRAATRSSPSSEPLLPILDDTGVRAASGDVACASSVRRPARAAAAHMVKVNYDSGNSASLGYDPRDEFAAYGARVGSVHIKDRVKGGSTVPLGTGDTDFMALFELPPRGRLRRGLRAPGGARDDRRRGSLGEEKPRVRPRAPGWQRIGVDLHLEDKVVLVAGSSRGIGLATARAFLAEGCRTVITGRDGSTLGTGASLPGVRVQSRAIDGLRGRPV